MDIALIKPPVITVTIVAVFFGLSFKILNLALPIFVPSRSPNGAINPPNKNYQANSHLMIGIKDQIYKIN